MAEVTSAFDMPAGNVMLEIAASTSLVVATPFKAALMEVLTPASVANPLVPEVIASDTCVSVKPGFAVM